jgi:hypothetical protein
MTIKRSIFAYVLVCGITFFSCKEKHIQSSENAAGADVSIAFNKNPFSNIDQSPMDMSWCPANYPVEKMQGNDSLKLIARIIYSRPHKKNRVIFGTDSSSLCMYGRVWRLGANEATEIDLFENVNIAGQNIAKGMYVMYCIPHADSWTIKLNKNLYTWGLHIKEADDIFSTEIPVSKQTPSLEDFTMVFSDAPGGANLIMAWDNVKAVLPVMYAK